SLLLSLPAVARARVVFFLRTGALAAFLRVVEAAAGARLVALLRAGTFFDAVRPLAGSCPLAGARVALRNSRRVSCKAAARSSMSPRVGMPSAAAAEASRPGRAARGAIALLTRPPSISGNPSVRLISA